MQELSLSLSLSHWFFFLFFPQFCEVKKLVIALDKIMLKKQICSEFSQKETCQNENNLCLPQFFWSILWWSDIDHHPQEPTLARDWKVEKFKNPAIFWWPVGTYCLNMAISEKKFSKFGNFVHLFHKKNPLYESHLIVWVTKWQKFHPKFNECMM